MIKDLIKIADQLDSAGFFREADQIDWVVNRLVIQSNILKSASEGEQGEEESEDDDFGVNPDVERKISKEEWDSVGNMELPYSHEEPFDSRYIDQTIERMNQSEKEKILAKIISSLGNSED